MNNPKHIIIQMPCPPAPNKDQCYYDYEERTWVTIKNNDNKLKRKNDQIYMEVLDLKNKF